jgi:hypothetical protein
MNITGYNQKMQGREYDVPVVNHQKLNRDKIYRITIYSKDVITGNLRDGIYQLDLPDFIQDVHKYHLAVEEAILFTGSTTSNTFVFESSVVAPDTYSTSTRTNTRVLFQMVRPVTANAPGSYYRTITSNTIGIPLSDLSMLRNNQLRITIKTAQDTSHDETSLPLASSGWSMTLVVFPFSP